jgi:hypothetical protein
MRLARSRALHPVLSRCKNIGREGGVNETSDTFDKTQTNLAYSDGEYCGHYKIVGRIPDAELAKFDDWMKPEYERMLTK